MSDDDLSIEKPELDLETSSVSSKDLPDEIPALLDKVIVEQTAKDSLEIDALLEDVHIYLEIGDLDQAKESYKRLHRVYVNLSEDQQREYYPRVQSLFKSIRDYNTFGAKLKRAFCKKKKKSSKKPKKSKDKLKPKKEKKHKK